MALPGGGGHGDLCPELPEDESTRGFLVDDVDELQRVVHMKEGRSLQAFIHSQSKLRVILGSTIILAGALLAVSVYGAGGHLRGLKEMMSVDRQGKGHVLNDYTAGNDYQPAGSQGNHSSGSIQWAASGRGNDVNDGLCLEVGPPKMGGNWEIGTPVQARPCWQNNRNQKFLYPFKYGQIRFLSSFHLCVSPPDKTKFDYFHLAECDSNADLTTWHLPDDGMGAIRWAKQQNGHVVVEGECLKIDAAVLKSVKDFKDWDPASIYNRTQASSGAAFKLEHKLIDLVDCRGQKEQASADYTGELLGAEMMWIADGNVRTYDMVQQPKPLNKHYGYLSEFWLDDKQDMSYRITQMVESFDIHEFQFYLAFERFSSPPAGYKHATTDHWMCAVQERPVNPKMVKHAISFIKNTTNGEGRTWLYLHAQAVNHEDARMLSGFQKIEQKDVTKKIATKLFEIYNEPPSGGAQKSDILEKYEQECGCRVPETMLKADQNAAFDGITPLMSMVHINSAWAIRIVNQWAQFAHHMGFDGIHWDTEGSLGEDQDHDAHTHIVGFLKTAVPYLQVLNLTQTLNFVDGFGWDSSLLLTSSGHGRYVAFKYWEDWKGRSNQNMDSEFWSSVNEDKSYGAGFVWACYPGWSQQHCCLYNERQNIDYHTDVVMDREGTGSWAKAYPLNLGIYRMKMVEEFGGSYLMFGDGLRHVQGPFLPDAQYITKGDIDKIQARRYWS